MSLYYEMGDDTSSLPSRSSLYDSNQFADRTDLFVEGETSVSVTKHHQVGTVQVDDQLSLKVFDRWG